MSLSYEESEFSERTAPTEEEVRALRGGYMSELDHKDAEYDNWLDSVEEVFARCPESYLDDFYSVEGAPPKWSVMVTDLLGRYPVEKIFRTEEGALAWAFVAEYGGRLKSVVRRMPVGVAEGMTHDLAE